jgi:ribosomal protein L29
MKTKEFKDLKNKDVKSLIKLLREKKSELAKKQMDIGSGKEKNLKAGMNIRRDIAKILTLVREKEILEKLEVKKEEK